MLLEFTYVFKRKERTFYLFIKRDIEKNPIRLCASFFYAWNILYKLHLNLDELFLNIVITVFEHAVLRKFI